MLPYFKSTYGSIIPFSSILSMTVTDSNRIKYNVKLSSGAEVSTFTFNNIVDHDEQIKSYETWLIDQYQRSSNANHIH